MLSDRPWAASFTAVLVVGWLVAGVAVPLWGFEDHDGASEEHIRRLKGEATQRAQLPAIRLQAAEAVALSKDPHAVAGVVVWRGPFGLPLGRAGIGEAYASEPYSPGSPWRAAGVWAAFAGVAMVLSAVAGKLAM